MRQTRTRPAGTVRASIAEGRCPASHKARSLPVEAAIHFKKRRFAPALPGLSVSQGLHGFTVLPGAGAHRRLYSSGSGYLAARSEPVMTDLQQRSARYRRLFGRLTPDEARNLIDRLQVLALTRPDTVRELETFFERDDARSSPARAASGTEDHPRA